ncbi:MAG: hypothetical protein KF819_16605 [Labilithrix sp.]|nr:hypothetical protein [Labilithrix sp.]
MSIARTFGCALACGVALATSRAEARDTYGSLGVDGMVMGAERGERGDLAYYFLMTPRYHMGLGSRFSLSVGVGLPLAQGFVIGISRSDRASKDVTTWGLGVNTPIELRFSPAGRDASGVVLTAGTSPLLTTASTCALGGDCPGSKPLAVVYGYTVNAGAGYMWKGGTFVTASYALGHMWPGGHKDGVPAIDGLYRGGFLSVGISFR